MVTDPVICPRCRRVVHPWPLARGARCSPADWKACIRNDPPFDQNVVPDD